MLVMDRERLDGAPLERGQRAVPRARSSRPPCQAPPLRRNGRRDRSSAASRASACSRTSIAALRRLTPPARRPAMRARRSPARSYSRPSASLLARLAARFGPFAREPQRMRHHARQRHEVVTVVLEHARRSPRASPVRRKWKYRAGISNPARRRCDGSRAPIARAPSGGSPPARRPPSPAVLAASPQPARRRQHVEVRQVVGRRASVR